MLAVNIVAPNAPGSGPYPAVTVCVSSSTCTQSSSYNSADKAKALSILVANVEH